MTIHIPIEYRRMLKRTDILEYESHRKVKYEKTTPYMGLPAVKPVMYIEGIEWFDRNGVNTPYIVEIINQKLDNKA